MLELKDIRKNRAIEALKKVGLLLNSDLYAKENGNWIDKSENEEYLKDRNNTSKNG